MARVVSVNLDAARVEGVLSTRKRAVRCREAADASAILARAGSAPPDLVVLSGEAANAADVAEALLDDPVLLGTALVAWQVKGSLGDTSRLLALGVRVVAGEEDALRTACDEALDAREGRTIRVDPRADLPAGPAGAAPPDLHGRRVLVADDDPAVRWFFVDLLRAQGCDVEEADDGEAALDRARRIVPDLVVSDIRMPRLDGLNLCRALRGDPILADVPVILLSWKEDWLRQAEGSGVEASAYLAKRSTPEEVLLRVHEILEPHARLERRFRKPGAVRGRLDGTAPYRLLRLAGMTHPDSRLTVRCGERAYEVHVREGAPRAATLLQSGGDVVRGAPALGALLTERSGRFTLAAEHSSLEEDLDGSLHHQLAPHVARARGGVLASPLKAALPAVDLAAGVEVEVAIEVPLPPSAPAPRPLAPSAQAWRAPPQAVAPTVPIPLRAMALRPRPAVPYPTAPLPQVAPVPTYGAPRPTQAAREELASGPQRALDRRPYARWLGVAAIAALGILLGAGARAMRQADAQPQASQAPPAR